MGCPSQPPAPAKPTGIEVADIFRAHGRRYCQTHAPTPEQRKVMRAIESCRTPALGGRGEVCDQCGYFRAVYNSCRNRHCPKCQSLTQAKWVDERLLRLVPTHYFHVVFTLPAELRTLCRLNPRVLYGLLFDAAAKTLLTLGQDPNRLGGQLGITAVLHTWTQELTFHPHVHCIVTGGGLSVDGTTWKSARRKYLAPPKVVSRLFRGLFLDKLKRAMAQGKLKGGDKDGFKVLLEPLYKTEWNVYSKRSFGGAEQVFKYLGRYTHRVGISNQRLVSMDEHQVSFATKDGRTITITPEQFIHRFLLHVLPYGFAKIRHYGLWASSNVTTRLPLARALLTMAAQGGLGIQAPPCKSVPSGAVDLDWRARLLRLTGIDVLRCPRCQQGRMLAVPLSAIEPLSEADVVFKDTS